MVIFKANNLKKSYGADVIFDNVSFDLKEGVDLSFIFRSSNLKTVYIKNNEVLNKFNDSDVTGKTDLNFIIK